MTDEEMADKHTEEYVMREDVVTENDRVPFDNGYGWQTVDFEKEVRKGYKDGFLAGLKAGRPQWHDLRKDPNDLPEDTYDVLDQAGYKVHYNFFQNVWVNEKDEIDEHVIAWCEIPTFEKE